MAPRPMVSSRVVLLAAAIASAIPLASCGDARAPTGPAAPGAALGGLLGHGSQSDDGPLSLLSCSPLPYDSVTLTIGPSGGVIRVGPHTFTVPAGALSQNVAITAVAPSGTVNTVHFSPDGLQFGGWGASLRLSYANCSLIGGLLPKRVAYIDANQNILSILWSVDDLFSQSVTGRVRHFSDYAVAW